MSLAPARGTFPIRVAVLDVWDHVVLDVSPGTTVTEVKRRALEQALGERAVSAESFIVKFRGGIVQDEQITLEELGARPNAALIVLPARRRPVR